MFNENKDNALSPELKDILEMVHRYNASHKEGCFLFSFVGFNKNPENVCEDCGGNCDEISDEKTVSGAYGDLEMLREMLNHMRDTVEDNVDENGFASF